MPRKLSCDQPGIMEASLVGEFEANLRATEGYAGHRSRKYPRKKETRHRKEGSCKQDTGNEWMWDVGKAWMED